MEEIIKQRIIIDIDTAPNWNKVYSGICLVANSEIIMLLNFNEENGEFDGFSILKNKDFEKYRTWDKEDYKELINDNSAEKLCEIKSNEFLDLRTSFENLKNELIAIFTYNDEESYYVGRIISINQKSLELEKIDKKSNWVGKELIEFEDISYIGFRTEYELKLSKNVFYNK